MQEALFLYLCIRISTTFGSSSDLRIYGGRDAQLGEFPYVVVLGHLHEDNNFELTCSCSALSPTWSLTAAHCMDSNEAKGVIAYGDIIPGQKFNVSKVLRVFPHPGYKSAGNAEEYETGNCYDIGLLRTNKIKIAQYGLLSAVDHTTITGHEVIVAGFGVTNGTKDFSGAIAANKTLQVFKGMISSCLEEDFLLCSRLCVSPTCKQPSLICGGDSGGPVIHASGIVGVNGYHNIECEYFTDDHSLAQGSSVVQAVSPVIDWLTNTINSHS
ncbi:trypsin-5-like [Pieris rapae]|uniref:trypsin-5-like n=1 Tax=Pieris rapae TaxID=64459 RepID=UPI001E28027A|nr:trypsin-5-like [Pieris rapae]